MNVRRLVVLLLAGSGVALAAQSAGPVFDVVSIKRKVSAFLVIESAAQPSEN